MPDCPASDQFGTLMKKTKDAGTSPVLGQANAVRQFLVWYRSEIINAGADAGISFLDTVAQLC